jgi:hypothetical protein
MAVAVPTTIRLTCPRCRTLRQFLGIDGATGFRCKGCEWLFTLSAVAPTGTSNAALAAGGTAIGVVSGGASFTNGMVLLYDTGQLTEVLTVNGSATGTSIPVTAAIRSHSSGATFGQLADTVTYTSFGVGGAVVPNPGWGF